MEGTLSITKGEKINFSEQYLMDCDTGNSACSGGTMKKAFKFLIANGNVHEVLYKYEGKKTTCNKDVSKSEHKVLNTISVAKSHNALLAAA